MISVGRIAGIRLRIHVLLLLLAAFSLVLGFGPELLILLVSLLLHELAHCLAAARVGAEISSIELLPFGGQAHSNDLSLLSPDQEIVVALAGPAASALIAGILLILTNIIALNYIEIAFGANTLLAAFNLLPALPLDGGRVLRAVLGMKVSYRRATIFSAGMGQGLAVLMVAGGGYLMWQEQKGIGLILIGIILLRAARRELKLFYYAFIRYLLHKKERLRLQGILPCRQQVCGPEVLLKNVLDGSSMSDYIILLVLDENHHLRGSLTEAEMIEALMEHGPRVRAGEAV
ncbi:MAG: site-2 protease family protein [Syntrophomonadaceae bacterium]|nr:site-2 protease family protein [Syntrophomonadaceae bacterium]